MNSSRRTFIKNATATGAAIIAAPAVFGSTPFLKNQKVKDAVAPFKLKYAPGFGMFREHAGENLIDNIKFCYDMGFRAMFDNGLMNRPAADQEKIAGEMQRLGMELGPFVLYADFSVTSFVLNNDETRKMLINKMKEGVEVAKRTGVKWALVVPGRYDEKLHRDFQTANVIDNLRYCCDVVDPAGLTIVLEPLNTIHDHPGLFLTGVPQAYSICRAVNRP
ncbi:MAG TPA: TIM barrel protein, partial [Bacteroidales bacterium]|nr:TIM barrel protein [Bacteroidales bacterium]